MANPYVKAALLTAAILLLGFFLIGQLDAMRASELRASVEELSFQSESERFLLLYTQAMANSSDELCGYLSKTAESKAGRAYSLAEKIRYYEQSSIQNTEYGRIKDAYYLANAELYLNIRTAEKYCGTTPYKAVLFFYKVNTECPECRAQGAILDALREEHPSLRVFAFPADTDREFINVFARRYRIDALPSLVIDDNTVLRGMQQKERLERYLS